MLKEEILLNSIHYNVVPLKSFQESLDSFPKRSQRKIKEKIEKMLTVDPYRYIMLKGIYTYKNVSFVGLRKMKTGVKGHRGGVYILYRICEECRKNGYYKKSGDKCEFCDDGMEKRVVLFIVRPRSMGY